MIVKHIKFSVMMAEKLLERKSADAENAGQRLSLVSSDNVLPSSGQAARKKKLGVE